MPGLPPWRLISMAGCPALAPCADGPDGSLASSGRPAGVPSLSAAGAGAKAALPAAAMPPPSPPPPRSSSSSNSSAKWASAAACAFARASSARRWRSPSRACSALAFAAAAALLPGLSQPSGSAIFSSRVHRANCASSSASCVRISASLSTSIWLLIVPMNASRESSSPPAAEPGAMTDPAAMDVPGAAPAVLSPGAAGAGALEARAWRCSSAAIALRRASRSSPNTSRLP
mmetsp:Transcript_18526/g.55303  ORF Transcript_18526/g.55303 Transcript_18526/m.55303 type:complete len:231 (-) Transcript_18526:1073-1765(-)